MQPAEDRTVHRFCNEQRVILVVGSPCEPFRDVCGDHVIAELAAKLCDVTRVRHDHRSNGVAVLRHH
jgi:hypothetical protein